MLQDEQYGSVYPSPNGPSYFQINYSNKTVNSKNMFLPFFGPPWKTTVFVGRF